MHIDFDFIGGDASLTKSISFTLTFMVVPSQSSAAGVLALLSEPDPVFKQHALKSLNTLVPRFWAEISEHIALMCVANVA